MHYDVFTHIVCLSDKHLFSLSYRIQNDAQNGDIFKWCKGNTPLILIEK
jgi:hypothetical protein